MEELHENIQFVYPCIVSDDNCLLIHVIRSYYSAHDA